MNTTQTQTATELSIGEATKAIGDRLGEDQANVRAQIARIVKHIGETQACAICEQAIQVEEQGGMMLPDGSRRRTVGGIFFYLAYTDGKDQYGNPLRRPTPPQRKKQPKAKKPKQQQQPAQPALKWDDRIIAIQEAIELKGNATVKMTLVGRPGKVVDRGSCIVTVMTSNKIPSLPKGLPAPTTNVTKYAVYIAAKQWKNVAQVVDDPEDVLIVEGFPCADKEVSAIAVFATSCTTKKLQAAKRQQVHG